MSADCGLRTVRATDTYLVCGCIQWISLKSMIAYCILVFILLQTDAFGSVLLEHSMFSVCAWVNLHGKPMILMWRKIMKNKILILNGCVCSVSVCVRTSCINECVHEMARVWTKIAWSPFERTKEGQPTILPFYHIL